MNFELDGILDEDPADADALASDAPALSKCVGMPDSGFFLDYQSSAVPATVEEEAVPWHRRRCHRRC